MVRELVAAQNYEQIERICKVLSEQFVQSQLGNYRRGGLIGIAALAIACGKVCERGSQFGYSDTCGAFLFRKRNDLNNTLFHRYCNVSSTPIRKFATTPANRCITLPKSCER